MCWGCQVVPIHIAVDDIDSPFIWNSARHSAIDFSIVGKIWNVPFYIITSQLLTCCCSHGMQVFLPPPYTHKQTSTQACVLAHRRELTHTRLLVMTQHEPPDKFSNTISSTRRLTNGHLSLSVQPHCFCSTFPSSVNTGLKDAERKVDHTKQKRYT